MYFLMYSVMNRFDRIIKKENSSTVVYEDDEVIIYEVPPLNFIVALCLNFFYVLEDETTIADIDIGHYILTICLDCFI